MSTFADELSCLALKYQRDANCLSDPDRSTRKRALVKLTKMLLDDRVRPRASLRLSEIFYQPPSTSTEHFG